jgi:hypothetical protein
VSGIRQLGVRIELCDVPQPHRGIVLFEASVEGRELPVALDYFDLRTIDEAAMAEVALYFKMQHDGDGYPEAHVVPGGYVAGNRELYRRLRLYRQVTRLPRGADVYARFGLRHGAELRRRAVDLLANQPELTFAGGLTRYE